MTWRRSPLAILEAMAVGCAVITADAGGIPGILTDRRSGILLHKPTAKMIVDSLRVMLFDNEFKNEWVKYEAKSVTESIVRMYRSLMERTVNS